MGGIDGGNIVRHQVYGSNSVFKPHPKTKTNADRIRFMSDEELAKTLNSAVCPPLTSCNEGQQCIKCWLEWLQQPAEEADNV